MKDDRNLSNFPETNKQPSSNELVENSKLVESFINEQIDSIDSSKLSNMLYTAKSVDKIKERIVKNANNINSTENYINFCGNIVRYCNEVCNPFVNKNSEQCGSNCVDKYFDQLNSLNKYQDYYSSNLSLSNVFFMYSDNYKYSKMISSLNKI